MEKLPKSWAFQFSNKDHNCSIILETIVNEKLWFWRVHLGFPSVNNNLNVLDHSPLVIDLLTRIGNDLGFEVMRIIT
jgi:hypothetical protein